MTITVQNKTNASFATVVVNGEARNRVFIGGKSKVTVGKELSAGSYGLLKKNDQFIKWLAAKNLDVKGDDTLKDVRASEAYQKAVKLSASPSRALDAPAPVVTAQDEKPALSAT